MPTHRRPKRPEAGGNYRRGLLDLLQISEGVCVHARTPHSPRWGVPTREQWAPRPAPPGPYRKPPGLRTTIRHFKWRGSRGTEVSTSRGRHGQFPAPAGARPNNRYRFRPNLRGSSKARPGLIVQFGLGLSGRPGAHVPVRLHDRSAQLYLLRYFRGETK